MAEPGWYHAEGDDAGTLRYWNGATWVGDPVRGNVGNDSRAGQGAASGPAGTTGTSNAGPSAATTAPQTHGGIVYYESSNAEIDLGDVARRVTLRDTDEQHSGYVRPQTRSPYSASKPSAAVRRRPPLPEGLKSLTILVCVTKAVPLVGLAVAIATVAGNDSTIGRFLRSYAPPGIDFDAGRGTAVVVMVAILVLTSGLLVAQARSSIDDRANDLFLTSVALVIIDGLGAIDQWFGLASGQGIGVTVLATLSLALQGWVTLWAGSRAAAANRIVRASL